MDTYLETERLALRRFTADDADLLIELDSDPAVMRYLTGGDPTPPEVVRERDLPSILAGYEKWGGDLGLFAAQEKDGGAFIGWFILRPEPEGPLDEVELGYRLRQAAWGKGYATEGSRALLAQGVHGARCAHGLGCDDVREPRFAQHHGEARNEARGHHPYSLRHGDDRGLRAWRRTVRDHQGAVAAAVATV